MNARSLLPVGLICVSLVGNVQAQGFTERGATLGGVAGALAGAAIGKHNHETAAGALIGGAVGLVTGAAIGSAQDQDAQRTQARIYAQQQIYAQRQAQAASVDDVVTMTRNGVADSVVVNHIQQFGVQRRIEVSDVIYLHQQGVSEPVISAMQRGRLASERPVIVEQRPVIVERSSPVIVEEYYYSRPAYFYHAPPPHWHHHYHHYHGGPPRSSASFSVRF